MSLRFLDGQVNSVGDDEAQDLSRLSMSSRSLTSSSIFGGTHELILFNDILLLVREGGRNKLRIIEWFNLDEILLDPDYEKDKAASTQGGHNDGVGQTFAILKPSLTPSDGKIFLMLDAAEIGWKKILADLIPKRGDFESKPFFVKNRENVSRMSCGDCYLTYHLNDRTRYTVIFMTQFGVAYRSVVKCIGGFMCPSLRFVADSEANPIVFSSVEALLAALKQRILESDSRMAKAVSHLRAFSVTESALLSSGIDQPVSFCKASTSSDLVDDWTPVIPTANEESDEPDGMQLDVTLGQVVTSAPLMDRDASPSNCTKCDDHSGHDETKSDGILPDSQEPVVAPVGAEDGSLPVRESTTTTTTRKELNLSLSDDVDSNEHDEG